MTIRVLDLDLEPDEARQLRTWIRACVEPDGTGHPKLDDAIDALLDAIDIAIKEEDPI